MATGRGLESNTGRAFAERVEGRAPAETARAAMERTHRWAARCLAAEAAPSQLRFGIVQGGFDDDLRTESAGVLAQQPFDGFGIGGLSLGGPESVTHRLLSLPTALFTPHRPRYPLGGGKARDP